MKLSNKEYKRAWEVFVYAEQLLAQRMNYGMVVQSMLLLAFVALLSSNIDAQKNLVYIKMAISFFGGYYSTYQVFRTHSMTKRIAKMRKHYFMGTLNKGSYEEIVYQNYMSFYKASFLEQKLFKTVMIPIGLLLVWLLLFIFSSHVIFSELTQFLFCKKI